MLTETIANHLLEPLCSATEQLLSPIEIRPTDFARIRMDAKSDRRFHVQVSCLREPYVGELELGHIKGRPDIPLDIVEVNGQTRVRDHRGPSGPAAKQWAKRIIERKELGEGRWIVAATDINCIVIKSCFGDQIVFEDEASKQLFNYLVLRFIAQTKTARIVADYRINKVIPSPPPDLVQHPTLPMSPEQLTALVACLEKESYALFWEQGLGKTNVVINRVNLEGARKRAGRLPNRPKSIYRHLVICPLALRLNWQKEFERFSVYPGKVTRLTGSQVGRVRQLVEGIRDEDDLCWSTVIISADSVESTWDALRRVPWDLVTVDESQIIKSSNAKRAKAIRKFASEGCSHARMILTGTPIANTPFDLWSQLEFLGEGMSGFNTHANFRSFYGKFKNEAESGVQRLIGIRNAPLLQERLARVAFTLTKKQAGINLPDKVYDFFEVEMTTKQAKLYRELQAQLRVELEEAELEAAEGKRALTAEHILTKLLRLAQITSGFAKWDGDVDLDTLEVKPGRVEQIDAVNPKIQAVVDMLTEEGRDPLGKTLIWAHFREDIRAISARLAKEGIGHVTYDGSLSHADREKAVERFNTDPTCKVFVANPAVAGAGLNLLGYDPANPDQSETYCDHEIFFSQGWSAVERAQAEDRAHRRGTRTNVRITDLVVPGTIDEEIRARVTSKILTATEIQDVRSILRRVLETE